MTTECPVEQNLCNIYRGDKIPFTFQFNNADGTPMDISGLKLYFTMKLVASSPDGEVGDLQDSVTFPTDAESVLGIGSMLVAAAKTELLTPVRDYFYDFQLIELDGPSTMGAGKIHVNQDITQATT